MLKTNPTMILVLTILFYVCISFFKHTVLRFLYRTDLAIIKFFASAEYLLQNHQRVEALVVFCLGIAWVKGLNVPIKMILDCRDKRQLKLLAQFVFIKNSFSDLQFLNCSYSEVTRKTGIPRGQITPLIRSLKKNKWILFGEEKEESIEISVSNSKDILSQLELFLLLNERKKRLGI